MAAVKPAQIVNVVVAHDQDKQTISKSLARTLPSSIRTIAMLTFIQILCKPSRDPRLRFRYEISHYCNPYSIPKPSQGY